MVNLCEADRRLSETGKRIDFYSYLTPVNRAGQQKKFFEAVGRGQKYNPVFEYKTGDLTAERDELYGLLSILEDRGPLSLLLRKKALFILSQLDLLTGGEEGFLSGAVRVYGAPDRGCIKEAIDILKTGSRQTDFPEETVSPTEMVRAIREYLFSRGISWEVRLSEKIVPKLTVSGGERTIYVNSDIWYTPQEVERLKVHEVEVHVMRGLNGEKQPYRIFAEGTAGYNETEEGIAIAAEKITGVLCSDKRQMKLYAGRAVCVDLCMRGSFFDVFQQLREWFPADIAYRLVERAKRGFTDTSGKGCITKGFHYISGLRRVREYINSGGDMQILYVGKIGIDDVDSVRKLISEGAISFPPDMPLFFLAGKEKRGIQ